MLTSFGRKSIIKVIEQMFTGGDDNVGQVKGSRNGFSSN